MIVKPCPNFPGYSCDEQGNVYSCFRYVRNSIGKIIDRVPDYSVKPRIMKPQLIKEPGRSQIRPWLVLRKDGKRKKVFVSRLIATTFIPNPHNYPMVRHLDDISTHNYKSNLAWGTNEVNVQDREQNQHKDLLIKQLREEIKQLKEQLNVKTA